jgi:uncharacterized protein YjbI with pentapeptide repeats
VALLGDRQEQGDKSAALKREIIGEILPEDCIDQSVAARMNLGGAYLRGAYLGGANLGGANLGGAYLGGSERPTWLPDLYEIRNGYICRKES